MSPFTTYHVNVSAIPEDRSYRPPAKITVTTQVFCCIDVISNMITIIGGHISHLVMVFVIGIDIPVTMKFMIIIFIINITTIQMAAPQPMVKPDFFGVKKDMNGVITVYLPQVQYWMIILIAILISKMVILR